MASHFTSLGFNISNHEDFSNYFQLTHENGDKIKTNLGTYIKWNIGCGIELWEQLDVNNLAIGLNPHFSGTSRIKVRIQNKIRRDNDSELDGAFNCWADPTEIEEDGVYPFVFDLPDMANYNNIEMPQTVLAQITGFAHELSAYRNDEEFDNSQESIPKFASKSFIPVGLFSQYGENNTQPEAMAIFSGHVIETRKIKNPFTGKEFIWVKVNTLGGEYDIVADPEVVDGNISIDGVVFGTFWLSGRIIGEYSERERKKEKFSLHKFLKKK